MTLALNFVVEFERFFWPNREAEKNCFLNKSATWILNLCFIARNRPAFVHEFGASIWIQIKFMFEVKKNAI